MEDPLVMAPGNDARSIGAVRWPGVAILDAMPFKPTIARPLSPRTSGSRWSILCALSFPQTEALTQVVVGGDHACGLRGDGTAVCWGKNDLGQATPPAGPFVQLAAGYRAGCGLRPDGSLACWGQAPLSQPPVGVNRQADGATLGRFRQGRGATQRRFRQGRGATVLGPVQAKLASLVTDGEPGQDLRAVAVSTYGE
jgi:hypothetical protein